MMSVRVSRHAVRRFAERVLGHTDLADLSDEDALNALRGRDVDLGAIVNRLRETCELAAALGASGVRAFNARVILKDSTVITVVPKDWCLGHYDTRNRRDTRD